MRRNCRETDGHTVSKLGGNVVLAEYQTPRDCTVERSEFKVTRSTYSVPGKCTIEYNLTASCKNLTTLCDYLAQYNTLLYAYMYFIYNMLLYSNDQIGLPRSRCPNG